MTTVSLVEAQAKLAELNHLLSPTAHAAITDPANDLLLSAASVWEIAIKVGLEKLTLSLPYRDWTELWFPRSSVKAINLTIFPFALSLSKCGRKNPNH